MEQRVDDWFIPGGESAWGWVPLETSAHQQAARTTTLPTVCQMSLTRTVPAPVARIGPGTAGWSSADSPPEPGGQTPVVKSNMSPGGVCPHVVMSNVCVCETSELLADSWLHSFKCVNCIKLTITWRSADSPRPDCCWSSGGSVFEELTSTDLWLSLWCLTVSWTNNKCLEFILNWSAELIH